MPKLTRLTGMLFELDATFGTWATPAVSANEVIVYEMEYEPLAGATSAARKPFLGVHASMQTPIAGLMSGKVKCKTYLCGSGTAGTAPQWGRMLIPCGWQQDWTTGTSVVYKPVGGFNSAAWSATGDYTGMSTASIQFNVKDTAGAASAIQYEFGGAMGNATFKFKAGEPMTVEFDFDAIYRAPSIVSFPSYVPVADAAPKPCLGATCTFTPSGGSAHTVVLRELEFSLNAKVIMRPDGNNSSGFTSALWVDREPSFKLVVEEPTNLTPAAGQNWYTNFSNQVTGALNIGPIGSAGNIVEVDMPNVGFLKVNPKDQDGIRIVEIEGTPAASTIATGDDEITITLT